MVKLFTQKLARRRMLPLQLIQYKSSYQWHQLVYFIRKPTLFWDLQYYYCSSQQAHMLLCIFVFILVCLESVSQSLLRRGRLQIACKCSSVSSVHIFSRSRLIASASWQFNEVCMCFVRLWDLSLDTYSRSAAFIQFATCMVNKSAPDAK